jgi:hypothetical protein
MEVLAAALVVVAAVVVHQARLAELARTLTVDPAKLVPTTRLGGWRRSGAGTRRWRQAMSMERHRWPWR